MQEHLRTENASKFLWPFDRMTAQCLRAHSHKLSSRTQNKAPIIQEHPVEFPTVHVGSQTTQKFSMSFMSHTHITFSKSKSIHYVSDSFQSVQSNTYIRIYSNVLLDCHERLIVIKQHLSVAAGWGRVHFKYLCTVHLIYKDGSLIVIHVLYNSKFSGEDVVPVTPHIYIYFTVVLQKVL